MKLGYVIIYVQDVEETIAFYQKAFSLKLKFLHESQQYAEMQTGETTLAFASESLFKSHGIDFRPNRPSQAFSGFEIALTTPHVQEAFDQALKAGAKQISPPEKKPWGQIVAYVADHNGVLIEICEPL